MKNPSRFKKTNLTMYLVLVSVLHLLISACAEESGSCVTVTDDGNYYCFNVGEEENESNGTNTYCFEGQGTTLSGASDQTTFQTGLSCEEVGYKYFCSYDQMKRSGGRSAYAVSRWLTNSLCDPGKPTGGSSSGSGANCFEECPNEFSDVQKDSFCRAACCYAVTGNPDEAESTCEAGESLGSRDCRYCR